MKELTKMENKVAFNITLGYAEKEIANNLHVSLHTIHAHARNIRRKIKARNIVDVARKYILSLENPKILLSAIFYMMIIF